MSTATLSGLRDSLCGSLTPMDMLWLSEQLWDYARQQREEVSEPPLKRYTMDEINAMLDEAERQAKEGEYVDNEEVFRRWDERRAMRKRANLNQDKPLGMAVAV